MYFKYMVISFYWIFLKEKSLKVPFLSVHDDHNLYQVVNCEDKMLLRHWWVDSWSNNCYASLHCSWLIYIHMVLWDNITNIPKDSVYSVHGLYCQLDDDLSKFNENVSNAHVCSFMFSILDTTCTATHCCLITSKRGITWHHQFKQSAWIQGATLLCEQ